jgi:hypothetical protein
VHACSYGSGGSPAIARASPVSSTMCRRIGTAVIDLSGGSYSGEYLAFRLPD